MNATELTIAAYQQMTRALRKLAGEKSNIANVPMGFMADLDQIITETEMAIARGELPFTEPASEGVSDVKALSRWLWNRGFGSTHMAAFDATHRALLMSSAGLTGTPELWQAAVRMVSRVEARIQQEPELALTMGKRSNEDEHEQWLPAAQEPKPAPETEPYTASAADMFKNTKKANVNRLAKAKLLARWLWDRNIDGPTVRGFTAKYQREIARAAGAHPPSSMDTWEVAFGLMDTMAARVEREPENPVTFRNHLDEHDGWVTDPHAPAGIVVA